MKKVSHVVPVYKDSYKFLAGCIPAIVDQDWKNQEIIIVLDGPNKKARDFIDKGKYFDSQRDNLTKKQRDKLLKKTSDMMKVIEVEHGGAPHARNAGAEVADGDYLIFTDPDVYWYPGSIRELIEACEDNDADYAYGHYEIVGGIQVQARPFSRRALYTTNYISGAFPVRREKDQLWDKTVKSLQDWDRWIRNDQQGLKGHYIDKSFFITEKPGGSGISKDSNENWIERKNYIREKDGVVPANANICVSSLGAELHGLRIADIIDSDYQQMPSFKPHEYDKIYLIGFYPQGANAHFQVFFKPRAQELYEGKKVIHWVGSDIRGLRRSVGYEQLKALIETFEKNKFIHLVEAKHTFDQMKEMWKAVGKKFKGRIVPIPPTTLLETMELPKKFTVAVYENPTQPDVYMPELMEKVAKAMPHINFKFFGDKTKTGQVDKNIEHIGWVDNMPKFIKSCSALLRVTTHDGLPISALEFMLAGRRVITNVPIKHAEVVDADQKQIVSALRAAKKLYLPDKGASSYWRKQLDHRLYRNRIEAL